MLEHFIMALKVQTGNEDMYLVIAFNFTLT